MGKEKPITMPMHCGHLTASDNKCSRNPIQSESESKSESNADICSEQTGGGKVYLAQNIKYLREQKGMSQRGLSDALGLSSSAVAMWEQRHRTPDIETIIKLAGYFEITLDEFVLRDLRPPVPVYAGNILFLRKKHDCSQGDLADLLKVKQSTISLYETGRRKMSVDDLLIVADFFGVTLDQLVKQDLAKGSN